MRQGSTHLEFNKLGLVLPAITRRVGWGWSVKVQNSSGRTGVLGDLWPGGKAWSCQQKPCSYSLTYASSPPALVRCRAFPQTRLTQRQAFNVCVAPETTKIGVERKGQPGHLSHGEIWGEPVTSLF